MDYNEPVSIVQTTDQISLWRHLADRAERKTSMGKDWHPACLRCEKCKKTLAPGSHSEHEGKPYCTKPCYASLFGPEGFGRGGTSGDKAIYTK